MYAAAGVILAGAAAAEVVETTADEFPQPGGIM